MKTVLITGANKGIGLETARQLAQQGCFVYIGSRDLSNGQQAADELKATGIANVAAVQLDVTDVDTINRAKEAISRQTGSLDVLINNSAIAGEQPQRLADGSMENLRHLFDTNFFGMVQTTQIMLPLLKASATPSIINVSSEVGSLTMNSSPDRRGNWTLYSGYGATKTAVNAFTAMLANELRDEHITVNSVTPGHTATGLNGFTGTKTVAEGAKPIVALALSTDRTVTGRFFKDGGEVSW
ncbi:SDR family NAD(P)-dependent oxidoreductase [Chitinophaga varians]|uniref:SDR family NAD(P)-dependent oxidoreductase n=1 Tax=Chitinophaga varians TaxID=2202339 RepID=UPI0016600506|nr:SDR family NAD(P)-dependent oxidoreductase [Chitinophaga varians]MBC9915520.1 SDR family NAD(P)-dependent oxidoreductase [Chitinophaga varians]